MWEAASVLDGSAKRGLIGGVGLNLGCSLGTAGGSPDSVSRDKNNEEPDCNYPIGAPRNLNTQRDTKRGFRTNCSRCVDFTAVMPATVTTTSDYIAFNVAFISVRMA